jgi:hypothetical protein
MGHNVAMNGLTWTYRLTFGLGICASAALAVQAQAQTSSADGAKPVYRCPGPPVLYTDALTAAEARARDCRTIEGAPITIVQGRAPRTAASAPPGAANGGSTAQRPVDRIDPSAQRARDTDARRILGEELRREEERLTSLQREFNNGQPERRGDERNYQKYLDRVEEMKSAIQRKEADVAALRREITKLPQ